MLHSPVKSILSCVDREVSPGIRDPLKALKEYKNYEGNWASRGLHRRACASPVTIT